MQNEPDYKAALEDLSRIRGMTFDGTKHADYVFGQTLAFRYETIKRALLIAHAVTQEPSESELKSGVDYCLKTSVGNSWPAYITNLRNVMRAKMIEEIDHA